MYGHEKLVKPDYKLARRSALALLRKAGVYEPPVDPVVIARNEGVRVKFVLFSGASEGVSGLFDFASNEILVNNSEAGVRQTFTIAHELGHKVLHAEWAESGLYQVLWRDPSKQNKDRREQEANAFAADLLMPKTLLDDYRQLTTSQLARLFAVSEIAMSHRISFLYG